MKTILVVLSVLCVSTIVKGQEVLSFGPRAGFGTLSASGGSEMKEGGHSAFGWEFEIPYGSGDLIGYGEAGFMLLGIEQSKVFPYVWGYFGCRYKNVGGGVGPAVNPVGIGLGFNLYYQFLLESIRIPVGFDVNMVQQTSRIQLFVGFNFR